MKTLKLIIPSLLIVSVAMGQSKAKSLVASNGNIIVGTCNDLKPSYFTINSSINKPWLTLSGRRAWNNPDTIIISVRKSQTRWLNDSTLIVTK